MFLFPGLSRRRLEPLAISRKDYVRLTTLGMTAVAAAAVLLHAAFDLAYILL